MTLLELDRLVRRLVAAMQSPTGAAEVLRLAEEYASACHQVNARLRQCEVAMAGGGDAIAIQLAEAPPHLMDVILRLEFREADAWRSFCIARRLPMAEPLEERVVQRLNDLYGRGIRGDDPLYQAFRAAVLSRRDEDALAAVRTIRRMNPQDANAASEVARLDARVLALRLARLREWITSGRPAEDVVAEVERIEAAGFESPLEGPGWREGQQLRCMHLLECAESARQKGDWRLCLRQVELCETLVGEYSLALPGSAQSGKASLRAWGEARQQEAVSETVFSQLVAELNELLARYGANATVAPAGAAKAQDDLEELNRIWRGIGEHGRPVPPDLEARFRHCTGSLATGIAHWKRRRRLHRSLAALVVTVIIITAGWLGLQKIKEVAFVRKLDAAVQARQVRVAEGLLNQLRPGETAQVSSESVGAAKARADAFVGQERALARIAVEAVAGLPTQLAPGWSYAELTTLQQQYLDTVRKLEAMAPDLQTETRPGLEAWQARWNTFLSGRKAVLESALEKELQVLQSAGKALDPALGVEDFRRQLTAAIPAGARAMELGFLSIGPLEAAATLRVQVVQSSNQMQLATDSLRHHDEAISGLRATRSFAELATAVSLLAKSDFKNEPLVQAAQSWSTQRVSGETLLHQLLTPGRSGLVSYLRASTQDVFLPRSVLPDELQILEKMKSDIGDVLPLHRWRLELRFDRGRTIDWIAIGAPPKETGWRTVLAYEAEPGSAEFQLSEKDLGWFGGVYSIGPQKNLGSLTDLGPCEGYSFLTEFAVRSLLPTNDGYPKPLLPQLTVLAGATSAPPLLRASLFLRLAEVMAVRPEEWGLAFSPSANLHRTQLATAMQGVVWADWLVPSKQLRVDPQLRLLLERMQAADYLAEAQTMVSLARALWKAGPKYAGHVESGASMLHWMAGSPPKEAWSFTSSGEPILIVAEGRVLPESFKAAPLSPIYAFDRPRQEFFGSHPLPAAAPPPPLFRGLNSVR